MLQGGFFLLYMKFERVSVPNSDAQFLETRKFQVNEICRIYRVPPHMVGDLERATFANIEHQSISFAVHTIRPWLVRIEQAMNRALFTDKEKGVFYVHFNMEGLMRGDYKSRMEGYAIARQNGWMSANDIRALENLNPISDEEGGNTFLVNGNMISVRRAADGAENVVENTTENADDHYAESSVLEEPSPETIHRHSKGARKHTARTKARMRADARGGEQ